MPDRRSDGNVRAGQSRTINNTMIAMMTRNVPIIVPNVSGTRLTFSGSPVMRGLVPIMATDNPYGLKTTLTAPSALSWNIA